MAYSLPLSILNTHRLIDEDIQRLGFYVYDNLETEQIDLQINRQIYLLIDGILDKHFGRKLKIGPQQGFQVDQVSLDNLRMSHIKGASRSLTTVERGYTFELPAGYYHYVKATAKIDTICKRNGVDVTETVYSKIRIVKSQDVDSLLNNPMHKTCKESPVAEIVGNLVYIYTDRFTISELKLDYIKKPEQVLYAKDIDGNHLPGSSINMDIDESLHYMVVEMTVLKIMKIIETNPNKVAQFEQDTN